MKFSLSVIALIWLSGFPLFAQQPRVVVREGERRAVLIGVDDYDDEKIPKLESCVADVEALATALEKCGYDPRNILKLTTKQPRNQQPSLKILKQSAKGWIELAGEKDTVLVFFSGHGFAGPDKKGYIIPADCQQTNLTATALPTAELRQWLADCKAQRKLLILDCCHSGAQRAIGSSSMPSAVTQDFVAKGFITLTSCNSDQFSHEFRDLGRGLFTHFLLKGLNGAADLNRDGNVNPLELYQYLDQEVRKEAIKRGVQQHPKLFGEVEGVFDLASVKPQPGSGSGGQEPPPPPPMPRKITVIDSDLLLIQPGRFMIGSPPNEPGRNANESQHQVTLTKPFYLGKFEVTVKQFREFVRETGYTTDAEKGGRGGIIFENNQFIRKPQITWKSPGFTQADNHPVCVVSYNDAQAFCQWAAKKSNRRVMLPTEAQWEYACRAGSQSRFSHGDRQDDLAKYANVADLSAKRVFPNWLTINATDGYVYTSPVGRYQPNAWGLYDMHGNVWEMCRDVFAPYTAVNKQDPHNQIPPAGVRTEYVIRGGSWQDKPDLCRCATREGNDPTDGFNLTGFRICVE